MQGSASHESLGATEGLIQHDTTTEQQISATTGAKVHDVYDSECDNGGETNVRFLLPSVVRISLIGNPPFLNPIEKLD